MKAGIAIDPWKIDIFKRHLDKAGFKYEQLANPDPKFTLLTVETDEPLNLQRVVEAAQRECARISSH